MYIVEGNIGAGKSTFLRLIQDHIPEASVAFEPLHNWQTQVYGQSLLANFYEDTKRWAYTMETLALACRVKEHLYEQEKNEDVRLMERSIYSGHYVFATNGYKNGFISPLEWNVYLEWFNFLVTGHCKQPRGFVYLQTDPVRAYERIKKRNRDAEKSISLEYIQQIHNCHESFLVEKKDILAELQDVPVLILDCNDEFETTPEQFKKHAKAVASFINAETATPGKVACTLEF